jgi:hypothetical protein
MRWPSQPAASHSVIRIAGHEKTTCVVHKNGAQTNSAPVQESYPKPVQDIMDRSGSCDAGATVKLSEGQHWRHTGRPGDGGAFGGKREGCFFFPVQQGGFGGFGNGNFALLDGRESRRAEARPFIPQLNFDDSPRRALRGRKPVNSGIEPLIGRLKVRWVRNTGS